MSETATIAADTVLVRAEAIISSEIDGDHVMMDVECGAYYALENVAGRVWDLLSEPTPFGELCATLGREYDVEPEQCERDTRRFIDQLIGRGVVRLATEGHRT